MIYCMCGGARLVKTKNTRVGAGCFAWFGKIMIGNILGVFALMFLLVVFPIILTCWVFGPTSVSCATCDGFLVFLNT